MAAEPVIRVRDLAIGWDGIVVQHDLTFDVRRGEVLAILGGSGSGKSTLLRFMIGLEQPLAGKVEYEGYGVIDLDRGLPPFGVMFQAGALFGSLTVAENVALPLEEWTKLPIDAIRVIAKAKLRLVDLEPAADKFPGELSGGMKKRVAIARALALEPEILFLDEPSAGLDPITSAEIDELVVALNRSLGLTVVLVSHELASVCSIAHRAIMLDAKTKSIIAEGDPREMRASGDRRVSDFFNRKPPEKH